MTFKAARCRTLALGIVFIQAMLAIALLTPRSHKYSIYQRVKSIRLDSSERPVAIRDVRDIIYLTDDTTSYFIQPASGSTRCFIAGTDWNQTKDACRCLGGYHGVDCGIPDAVWHSEQTIAWDGLKARQTPRRIIHAFNVNHEIDFFEIRMAEVGDVVDVFMVAESNWTAGGDYKPLYLLPQLQRGFQRPYHSKILHVLIDQFPDGGLVDGWIADAYIRNCMGYQGLKRIQGMRDDDLLVLLDADEIPSREILLFLKLYDGYPQPVALNLRWSIYGYFWKQFQNGAEQLTNVVAAASIQMVRELYEGKIMAMRYHHIYEDPIRSHLEDYHGQFQRWNIGKVGYYCGHHCSWCFPPEGIQWKLKSAQRNDKPRWGDYPKKLDLKYIQSLITNGEWFDGKRTLALVDSATDRHFAPTYVLKNPRQFDYLLHRNETRA